MLAGQGMTGTGLEAVVVTVAELLFGLGSLVEELTDAVLLITVPSATEQFAVATMVIVADCPAASESNVTVRLLAEPPQTPPPVEEHDMNVVLLGRLSVTVTRLAAADPSLVTVIVCVMFEPVVTVLDEAMLVIDKSAFCGSSST
jgi:hypothetical protein